MTRETHSDVTEYKWIPTGDVLEDALTEFRVVPAILVKVLRTDKLRSP